jgi:hypothetical protein
MEELKNYIENEKNLKIQPNILMVQSKLKSLMFDQMKKCLHEKSDELLIDFIFENAYDNNGWETKRVSEFFSRFYNTVELLVENDYEIKIFLNFLFQKNIKEKIQNFFGLISFFSEIKNENYLKYQNLNKVLIFPKEKQILLRVFDDLEDQIKLLFSNERLSLAQFCFESLSNAHILQTLTSKFSDSNKFKQIKYQFIWRRVFLKWGVIQRLKKITNESKLIKEKLFWSEKLIELSSLISTNEFSSETLVEEIKTNLIKNFSQNEYSNLTSINVGLSECISKTQDEFSVFVRKIPSKDLNHVMQLLNLKEQSDLNKLKKELNDFDDFKNNVKQKTTEMNKLHKDILYFHFFKSVLKKRIEIEKATNDEKFTQKFDLDKQIISFLKKTENEIKKTFSHIIETRDEEISHLFHQLKNTQLMDDLVEFLKNKLHKINCLTRLMSIFSNERKSKIIEEESSKKLNSFSKEDKQTHSFPLNQTQILFVNLNSNIRNRILLSEAEEEISHKILECAKKNKEDLTIQKQKEVDFDLYFEEILKSSFQDEDVEDTQTQKPLSKLSVLKSKDDTLAIENQNQIYHTTRSSILEKDIPLVEFNPVKHSIPKNLLRFGESLTFEEKEENEIPDPPDFSFVPKTSFYLANRKDTAELLDFSKSKHNPDLIQIDKSELIDEQIYSSTVPKLNFNKIMRQSLLINQEVCSKGESASDFDHPPRNLIIKQPAILNSFIADEENNTQTPLVDPDMLYVSKTSMKRYEVKAPLINHKKSLLSSQKPTDPPVINIKLSQSTNFGIETTPIIEIKRQSFQSSVENLGLPQIEIKSVHKNSNPKSEIPQIENLHNSFVKKDNSKVPDFPLNFPRDYKTSSIPTPPNFSFDTTVFRKDDFPNLENKLNIDFNKKRSSCAIAYNQTTPQPPNFDVKYKHSFFKKAIDESSKFPKINHHFSNMKVVDYQLGSMNQISTKRLTETSLKSEQKRLSFVNSAVVYDSVCEINDNMNGLSEMTIDILNAPQIAFDLRRWTQKTQVVQVDDNNHYKATEYTSVKNDGLNHKSRSSTLQTSVVPLKSFIIQQIPNDSNMIPLAPKVFLKLPKKENLNSEIPSITKKQSLLLMNNEVPNPPQIDLCRFQKFKIQKNENLPDVSLLKFASKFSSQRNLAPKIDILKILKNNHSKNTNGDFSKRKYSLFAEETNAFETQNTQRFDAKIKTNENVELFDDNKLENKSNQLLELKSFHKSNLNQIEKITKIENTNQIDHLSEELNEEMQRVQSMSEQSMETSTMFLNIETQNQNEIPELKETQEDYFDENDEFEEDMVEINFKKKIEDVAPPILSLKIRKSMVEDVPAPNLKLNLESYKVMNEEVKPPVIDVVPKVKCSDYLTVPNLIYLPSLRQMKGNHDLERESKLSLNPVKRSTQNFSKNEIEMPGSLRKVWNPQIPDAPVLFSHTVNNLLNKKETIEVSESSSRKSKLENQYFSGRNISTNDRLNLPPPSNLNVMYSLSIRNNSITGNVRHSLIGNPIPEIPSNIFLKKSKLSVIEITPPNLPDEFYGLEASKTPEAPEIKDDCVKYQASETPNPPNIDLNFRRYSISKNEHQGIPNFDLSLHKFLKKKTIEINPPEIDDRVLVKNKRISLANEFTHLQNIPSLKRSSVLNTNLHSTAPMPEITIKKTTKSNIYPSDIKTLLKNELLEVIRNKESIKMNIPIKSPQIDFANFRKINSLTCESRTVFGNAEEKKDEFIEKTREKEVESETLGTNANQNELKIAQNDSPLLKNDQPFKVTLKDFRENKVVSDLANKKGENIDRLIETSNSVGKKTINQFLKNCLRIYVYLNQSKRTKKKSVLKSNEQSLEFKHVCWIPLDKTRIQESIWEQLVNIPQNLNLTKLRETFADESKVLLDLIWDKKRTDAVESKLEKLGLSSSTQMKIWYKKLWSIDFSDRDTPSLNLILEILPEESERIAVGESLSKDLSFLDRSSQWILAASSIANLDTRLRVFLFKSNFANWYSQINKQLDSYLKICDTIVEGKEFRKFLNACLQSGNTLNMCSGIHQIKAFQISSLSSLYKCKSDTNVSLLEYLIYEFSIQDTSTRKMLDELKQKIDVVKDTSVLQIWTEISKAKSLFNKMRIVFDESQKGGFKDEFFILKFKSFFVKHAPEVIELESKSILIQEKVKEMVFFLGENESEEEANIKENKILDVIGRSLKSSFEVKY